MHRILKKSITGIALILAVASSAQTSTHVVSVAVTENVIAELWVNKVVGKKSQRVAEFKISPANKNFIFAVPTSGAIYQVQLNLMKPGKHHPEMDKVQLFGLNLNTGQDYSLKITPSKLDSTQKKGWELKQIATTVPYALITGKITTGTKFIPPVSFNIVSDGEIRQLSTYGANEAGEFAIPVEIKQAGFYYLATPRCKVRLYLHPREKLDIEIDNKTGLITSTNSHGTNDLLFKWQQLISPITSYGYNLSQYNLDSFDLQSYISEYKKLQPAMEEFLNNFDMTDQREYRAVQNAMILDRDFAPINLLFQLSAKKMGPFRAMPKEFNQVPEFYKQFIQPKKFGSTSLLLLGETRQFMKLYALLNVGLVPKEKRENLSKSEKLQLMMNSISNDTLKSFFFKDQMDATEINNLSEFKETFEPFKKYAKLSPASETYKSIYGMFSDDTAYIGKSSYNFSLPDTAGKMVSLKDFKGKVIFIDVWATWCGPCRAQIPFLKEIEAEYSDNKDIIFVGISLDRQQDRQKWINMIKKENLHGVQLLDDMGKAFGKKYQISAIPRFLLVSKEGKWIEIRCPLPEAKDDLKRYLNNALQENSFTRE